MGDGKTATGPDPVCSTLAEHFATIGERTVSHLPPATSDIEEFIPDYPTDTFHLQPISPLSVCHAISKSKSALKGASVRVPSQVIKNCVFYLAYLISHTFSLSMSCGIFPTNLRKHW